MAVLLCCRHDTTSGLLAREADVLDAPRKEIKPLDTLRLIAHKLQR